MDDPRRVRALFVVAGNPVATWPDQHRVVEAMKHLDLLVCIDIFETATTRFADYVIAGKHQLEVAETSLLMENSGASSAAGRHWQLPYAMYSPAVVEPPADSDVIDESQFFFRLARSMDLQLKVRGVPLEMTSEPSVDELLSVIAEGGRVPLATVMTHPSGYVDTGPAQTIAAPTEDNGARLHVGHDVMVKQLTALARPRLDDPQRPYRLISRRMREVCNSSGQNITELVRGRSYNPAFMHPDDLQRLGVAPGDLIEIASAQSAVLAMAEADDRLKRGTVSCAHAWGDAPNFDDVRDTGTNTNRLVAGHVQTDQWSGIPLMSAIPVAVRAYDATEAGHAS
jgi:anaerobic selenocysteine-containing dehydrogenase